MAFVIAIPDAAVTDPNDITTWDLTQAIGANVPDAGGDVSGLTNGTAYRLARLSPLSDAVTPEAVAFGNVIQWDYAHDNDSYASEISPQFANPPSAGHLLMLIGSKDKDQQEITPPAGWTTLINVSEGNGASAYVAYKISDGSETGPLTVTTISGQRGGFMAVEIEGSFDANPFGQQIADHDTANQRQIVGPVGITTSAPQALLVGYATNDSYSGNDFIVTSSNPVFGFAESPNAVHLNSGSPGLMVAIQVVPAGTYEFTVDTGKTDQAMGGLIEVLPAA